MINAHTRRATSAPRRRGRALVIATVVAALALLGTGTAARAASGPTAIDVNGASAGRVFGGVGAASAGGGNLRLLTDYPAAQRRQILDYLFTPDYGANLQILKVEIGGDTNSTDGSESSIEHSHGGPVNCGAGYEWWLMKQAKARNPAIKLYGLAWGAPGWLGGGQFWSTDTVNYMVKWLGCAKRHGLHIDYLGGWNEKGYNVAYYEQLRAALDAHGFRSVQIVGADSDWSVANAIATDPKFAKAISVIGVHYPCEGGDGGDADTCPGNATAASTGKPMWASENGSQDLDSGAPALIRSITRGYTDGGLTGYINWPLIAAVYPNMPYDTTGLMLANEPWSGAYSLAASLWATAQVTQFTRPGWQFLDDGSGYLGGAESNGSYVTLASPSRHAFSTIIETTTATTPQTVTLHVRGGLPAGAVHVWSTDLSSSDPSGYFVHQPDVTPSDGTYTLTVQPGRIYTVSTVSGAQKGQAPSSPPHASLALPYSDGFDHTRIGQQPLYLAQQQGAFEAERCAGGRGGRCLRQQAPVKPIEWDGDSTPYTIGGDLSWSNYTVSVDALVHKRGAVQLLGRVGSQRGFDVSGINAYYLQVAKDGSWAIIKNDTSGNLDTLAFGKTRALGSDRWHRLALRFDGDAITASVDGRRLGAVTDASYDSGMVGLGTNGYETDEFDNLSVTPIGTPQYSTVYQLTNRNTGEAMAVSGATSRQVVQADPAAAADQQWIAVDTAPGQLRLVNAATGAALRLPARSGAPLTTAPVDNSAAERWHLRPTVDGYDVLANGREAADAPRGATGSPVRAAPRNGGLSQQWQLRPVLVADASYEIRNGLSDLNMDVEGASTAAGAGIVQQTVNGGKTQQWKIKAGADGSYTLTNAGSGMLLDVAGASKTENAKLVQEPAAGTPDQQWRIGSIGAGMYTLTNVNSGLVADDSNQVTTPDNPIIQWPSDGGANQRWRLIRTK